jgi:hypothetical protein
MEAIHLSLSDLGKQILCLITWQADEEEEEAIHLFLIVESNPLSDVEAAAEGETIISLSLSLSLTCGNDPLSHVEAEE